MDINNNIRSNAGTVTGIFATKEDADRAYDSLMELGYSEEEITLIMSEETQEKLYGQPVSLSNSSYGDESQTRNPIVQAIRHLGKFVSFPGVAMVVAANFNDGGIRALSASVMSDKYAQFFRGKINEGEIVIDFKPHSVSERNYITGLWKKFGGFPLIRRLSTAA
ncbi:hypothetical protein [Dyadobacter sp. CY312]|uniref:hypothetical protein n=1 Tax=Dyadobacter sp. CY312 TaxID=2907303 RepID=UPI001F416151|nr:hypothetical protein [Dyadobacter sp. CY312]MCE7041502.1 hypothetical protein [Dyadobacter sp. CY312]